MAYILREQLYEYKHNIRIKYYTHVRTRFAVKLRKRLKNDNFSILCSNCIGGTIYNRLGKQFLSPTINLWFYQKDFLKFIQNIHYYLSLELRFIKSNRNYPVGMLDDICIYFLHYNSEEEAKTSWNRRKERINFDNLFIIMYDRDGIDEEDYEVFARLKFVNRIMLSDKANYNYPFVKQMTKENDNDTVYLDKDKYGIRSFEKQWNYVDWLNKRDNIGE